MALVFGAGVRGCGGVLVWLFAALVAWWWWRRLVVLGFGRVCVSVGVDWVVLDDWLVRESTIPNEDA